MPFPRVIARLEYELAYYDCAVHRFNHYATRTPPYIHIPYLLDIYKDKQYIYIYIYIYIFIYSAYLYLIAFSEFNQKIRKKYFFTNFYLLYLTTYKKQFFSRKMNQKITQRYWLAKFYLLHSQIPGYVWNVHKMFITYIHRT